MCLGDWLCIYSAWNLLQFVDLVNQYVSPGWRILDHYYFQYLFCPISSLLAGTPVACLLNCLLLSHRFVLCFLSLKHGLFSSFLYLFVFQIGYFLLICLQVHWLFLLLSPIWTFHVRYWTFKFHISIFFFHSFCFFIRFPIRSFIKASFKSLNIFIIIAVLKPLSVNSSIWVTCGSTPVDCFIFLLIGSNCLFKFLLQTWNFIVCQILCLCLVNHRHWNKYCFTPGRQTFCLVRKLE